MAANMSTAVETGKASVKPAPTEWHADAYNQIWVDCGFVVGGAACGGTLLGTLQFDPDWSAEAQAANLRRICEAVNSHEAMREALKEALEIMDDHRQFLARNYRIGYPKDPEFGEISAEGKEEIEPWDGALETIRAALALAESAP